MLRVQLMTMKTLLLEPKDRVFFQKVRLAIFANPFSDERVLVDYQLTGKRVSSGRNEQVRLLIQVVEERLNQVYAGTERPIVSFKGEDRKLVLFGILFHIFHKYCADFDDHIRDQIQHGDKPCRVSFADTVLNEMLSNGIESKEAVRFFALFFQMRRAFYFIDRIVGKSPSMKKLRHDLWNNIFTHDIGIYERHLWNRMEDFSTMLLGPTGTGKGLAASAIGSSGYIPYDKRKNCFAESFTRVFVSINLSQFPEQLVESELFGHKKGSFTGAIEGHEGIFSLCSPSGAIFLDEIGEVSVPVQIKLLQVLQDRIFSPVGSHRKKRFYGRVIAATNQSIQKLRKNGKFRDDFYYRLCSDIIYVPPLSQRIQENPDELGDLLAHTLKRIIGKSSPELVLSTLNIIRQQLPSDYPWPGNVRELEQSVRRILLKQQYEGDRSVTSTDEVESFYASLAEGNFTAHELLSRYCRLHYDRLGTYEAVAKQIELDRRTVKKYIDSK